MTTAYDRELRRFAKQAAFDLGMDSFVREGVYVHISGPNYETPSESIFLRNIGADAVGMSTAPEVTIARHADIKVLGESSFCATVLHISLVPSHPDYFLTCIEEHWGDWGRDSKNDTCKHVIKNVIQGEGIMFSKSPYSAKVNTQPTCMVRS